MPSCESLLLFEKPGWRHVITTSICRPISSFGSHRLRSPLDRTEPHGWCMETSPSHVFNKSQAVLLLMTFCQFGWIFSFQEVGCILCLLNIGDFIKDRHHYLSMTQHFGVVKYYLWLDQLVDIWSGKCFSLLKTMVLCHSAYKMKSSTKRGLLFFSNWHQKGNVSKWATLSYWV